MLTYSKKFVWALAIAGTVGLMAAIAWSVLVFIASEGALKGPQEVTREGGEDVREIRAYMSGSQNAVEYMGKTSATYDGNLGGITGANAKCNSKYSGSHMCTQGEFLRSGTTSGDGSSGWISCDITHITPGPSGSEDTACDGVAYSNYESGTKSNNKQCSEWRSGSSFLNGPIMHSDQGDTFNTSCNNSYAIHCCK